jgi:hypothetical protein
MTDLNDLSMDNPPMLEAINKHKPYGGVTRPIAKVMTVVTYDIICKI